MSRGNQYTDAEMCEALRASGGMVYIAADQLTKAHPEREKACAPSTIYRRAEKSTKVADAIDTAIGQTLDIAESHVRRAVLAGEKWALIYYLDRKGRERGYGEGRELTGKNGGPIQVDNRVFDHGAALAALARASGGPTRDSVEPREDEIDSDGAAVG